MIDLCDVVDHHRKMATKASSDKEREYWAGFADGIEFTLEEFDRRAKKLSTAVVELIDEII